MRQIVRFWLLAVMLMGVAASAVGIYTVSTLAVVNSMDLADCRSAWTLMKNREQIGETVRQEDWDRWRAMCTPPQAPAPVPGPPRSTGSPTPPPSDPGRLVQPCVFYANSPVKLKEHPGSFGPKVGLLVPKPMSRLTATEAREEFTTALSKDCMLLAAWSVHFGVRTLDTNKIIGQYVGADAVRHSDLARLRAKLAGMKVSLRELPAGETVLTVAARPGKVPQVHEVETAYSKPSQILVFTDRDGLVREVRINCYGQPLLVGSKDPTRRFYPEN